MTTENTDLNTAETLIVSAISADKRVTSVWNQMGTLVQEKETLNGADIKERSELFYKQMEEGNSKAPEKGKSRKTGKSITLRKEDGTVKWSEWSATGRICQNWNDVNKCIDLYDVDTVFPKGKLLSRPKVRELIKDAKAPESPIDALKRGIKLAMDAMPNVELADFQTMDTEILQLVQAHGAHTVARITLKAV